MLYSLTWGHNEERVWLVWLVCVIVSLDFSMSVCLYMCYQRFVCMFSCPLHPACIWLIWLSLCVFESLHVGWAPLAHGYWTDLRTANPLRLNCPHRLFLFWFWQANSPFANPLERCLALQTVAQRAAPCLWSFEQVPWGSLLASETQPPILSDPLDEPGKCCTKEIFCPG